MLADDARTRVVAWLGGPCSISLVMTSGAEGALLLMVQERRGAVCMQP